MIFLFTVFIDIAKGQTFICVCCNSLVVLQQIEAREENEHEQSSDG